MTNERGLQLTRRQVDRSTLSAKNRGYLESLRHGHPDRDIRAQILDAIFDTTGDAILVFDENKRIVLANHVAAEMSGWDLEDTSRQWLHEHYQFFRDDRSMEPLPVEEEPLEVAFREKRPCLRQYFIRPVSNFNGGRWLEAHAAPILDADGNVVGGVTTFRDVTEATQAKFQRNCLMSLIAHDLKNHLAAETILLQLAEKDNTDREFLEVIKAVGRTNERFLLMTESLMELARSEFFLHAVGGQSIDLRKVLEDAIAHHESIAREKNVSCDLDLPPDFPPAYGLVAAIQQVFINVVLNAIEASPPNAAVTITGKISPTGGPIIAITDKGPGIPPDELEALFDARRVATHERRTSHSTGFGLYLTAMLVQSLGGTIRCTSAEGEGTTVEIGLTPVPSAT
jgi:PAS domain S-box-containing protein